MEQVQPRLILRLHQFVPFEEKYPPEWTNMRGEMVLVNNDINATWKAMEALVSSGELMLALFLFIPGIDC